MTDSNNDVIYAKTHRRQLLQFLIAAVLVAGLAFVGYQVYVSAAKMRRSAEQRMARHNMLFTKGGGMRVGVRQVDQESYVDRTQRWAVKAWNMGESAAAADPNNADAVKRSRKKNKKSGGSGSDSGRKGGR